MCGIDGYFSFEKKLDIKDYYPAHLKLAHRGPDDEGFIALSNGKIEEFCGDDSIEESKSLRHIQKLEKSNLILGHRRLSIIDLSAAGHQPFRYENYYVIFNGEIYNYIELKEELSALGMKFKTQTDTEVFIAAIAKWGMEAFHRFNGMWAAAIYESDKEELTLCRDRYGIKPLYYHLSNKTLFFASEARFILSFFEEISSNPAMIYDYVNYGYINHTEQTMFEGVNQLLPGHYAVFNKSDLTKCQYYKVETQKERDIPAEKIKNIFFNSVKKRMRSDVEVGSLLSGGMDSSSIVCAIYSEKMADKMQTFTITYAEKELDFESKYVDEIIQKTGFQNKKINLEPDSNLIDELTKVVEFPYRSSTELAMYNIYRYIGQNTGVTVLLNGEGSDEIFGGYNFHFPIFLLSLISKGKLSVFITELSSISARTGKAKREILLDMGKSYIRSTFLGRYIGRNSFFRQPEKYHYPVFSKDPFENILIMNRDYSALPEYLMYGDKISMNFSLEVRVPFLDHQLVNEAAKVEHKQRIHKGESKYILRKSMENILPPSVINRKDKKGFFTPHDQWLKGVLAKNVEAEFEKIKENGLFRYMNSDEIYNDYKKNINGHDQAKIWRIYCLSRWKYNWEINN